MGDIPELSICRNVTRLDELDFQGGHCAMHGVFGVLGFPVAPVSPMEA